MDCHRKLSVGTTFCGNGEKSEVDEIFKKLKELPGVVGVVATTAEGSPIKSTMDDTTTMQYATLVAQLCEQTRSTLRDLEPGNDLTFLRVRTKKHELIISPDKNYCLIVITSPSG